MSVNTNLPNVGGRPARALDAAGKQAVLDVQKSSNRHFQIGNSIQFIQPIQADINPSRVHLLDA